MPFRCACCIPWALFCGAHTLGGKHFNIWFLFQQGYHWDTSIGCPAFLCRTSRNSQLRGNRQADPLCSTIPRHTIRTITPEATTSSDFPPRQRTSPSAGGAPPLPPQFSDQFESIHPAQGQRRRGSPGSRLRGRRGSTNQYLPSFYAMDLSEPQKAALAAAAPAENPYAPYPAGYPRTFEAPSGKPAAVGSTPRRPAPSVSACCEAESEVMMSDYEERRQRPSRR